MNLDKKIKTKSLNDFNRSTGAYLIAGAIIALILTGVLGIFSQAPLEYIIVPFGTGTLGIIFATVFNVGPKFKY